MNKDPSITEEEIVLIKRAQAGDESAFTELFHKYKPFVEGLLKSYISDEDEARDMVNEVFMKLYRKLSKFVEYKTFGGWLRILTKNTAVDYLRQLESRKNMFKSTDTGLMSEYTADTHDLDVVDQITVNQLFNLLKQYPTSTQRIFELFYIKNMTVEKINKVTGIPTGTIKSTLARTRRKLQQQLKIQPL